VIATRYQRQGYASEAAAGMATRPRHDGMHVSPVHPHPDHRASTRVPKQLGLTAAGTVVDGDTR